MTLLMETRPLQRPLNSHRSVTNYVIEGSASSKALDIYHLVFAPTYACNLRCGHCYLPDHKPALLSESQAFTLLQDWTTIVLAERGRYGGIFHLKGGEPFVVPYFSRLVDRMASDNALIMMITTNGTVRAKRNVEAIVRCNEALNKRVVVNVSLDGSKEETHGLLRGPGNFAKTLDFIRQLRKRDVIVHLNSVIHRKNIGDIEECVSLATREGVSQINFLPFVPKGYGSNLWDWGLDPLDLCERLIAIYRAGDIPVRQLLAGSYADILRREGLGISTSNECVGGYRGLFYVLPNGDVYSCPNLVSPELRVGNLHEKALSTLHVCLQKHVYSKTGGCGACSNRYICKGESLLRGPELLAAERRARLNRLQQHLLESSLCRTPSSLSEGRSYCFSRNL